MSIMEKWKHVIGFEGLYLVSDHGRVWGFPRKIAMPYGGERVYVGGLMRGTPVNGHLQVALSKLGHKKVKRYIHQLVLEAFVGPCPNGQGGCHWDGDALNNRLSNLRWDTPKNNKADDLRNDAHPIGERHGMSKLTADQVREIRRRVACGAKILHLAREYGVSRASIGAIRDRKNWKHI